MASDLLQKWGTGKMLARNTVILVMILWVARAVPAAGQIIPPARMIKWIPGSTVGIQGGMPTRTNLLDVTQPPYNADKTGATDASVAIQSAINSAQSNDVVYFPDGMYLLTNSLWFAKSYITLRGHTNSVLVSTNRFQYILKIGNDPQSYRATTYAITNGSTKGSTNLILSSPPTSFGVGDQIVVTENTTLLGSAAFPVIDVLQYDRVMQQQCVVAAINGNNIALSAPLVWDFTNSPVAMDCAIYSTKGIGVENLILQDTNALTGATGGNGYLLYLSMCENCWATHCAFQWGYNYSVFVTSSCHIWFAHNAIQHSLGSGPNHSGLLASTTGESLFEDNIFSDGLQPAIEFNQGFCGNAVFGNYFTNNIIDIDCHDPHPLMNLWEANDIAGSFEMDGYYGSASHQTLFRNVIRSPYIPVLFKRWITDMNVVGNVLGSPGNTYSSYASEVNGAGWMIFQFGYPNIGNNTYGWPVPGGTINATSPPTAWNYPGPGFYDPSGASVTNGIFTFTNAQIAVTNLIGNFTNIPANIANFIGAYTLVFQDGGNTNIYYPTDGVPVYPLSGGTSSNLVINRPLTVGKGWTVYVAGQNAYQQLQTGNKATDLITGNYDYFNKAVTWDTNGVQTIPASLLYTTGAPSWWGTNHWPAIDPTNATPATMIPAQERYLGIPVGSRPTPPSGLRINP